MEFKVLGMRGVLFQADGSLGKHPIGYMSAKLNMALRI